MAARTGGGVGRHRQDDCRPAPGRLSGVLISEARVLLTTFSDTLANALRTKLRRLISHEPRLGERLEVHAMNALGQRLYALHFGRRRSPPEQPLQPLLTEVAREVHGHKFSQHFY